MTGQPDLFMATRALEPKYHRGDPATSKIAAVSVREYARTQQRAVLAYLATHGPATADAVDAALGWDNTRAGRRLGELRDAHAVERLDETVPTRTGRPAHLYRIVP